MPGVKLSSSERRGRGPKSMTAVWVAAACSKRRAAGACVRSRHKGRREDVCVRCGSAAPAARTNGEC